jgi:hypothetical protein
MVVEGDNLDYMDLEDNMFVNDLMDQNYILLLLRYILLG